MRRKVRPLAALAMVGLISLVALIGAGCSNAPVDTTSSSGDTNAATHEKAMTFAACMRDNGVREFPDPDASGTLTIDGIANGSSLDTGSAAFKQALSACKDLQPPGFMGRKRSAQQQEYALKFAHCMRENGVKDFPDPTPDGPLIDTTRIPSMAGKSPRSDPGFNAAMEKCRDVLAGALEGQR
jgi:hypothetical protein